MKKLLALVLSLIMIMTSVFIVPFSVQAEQYPILPIPGTTNLSLENYEVDGYWRLNKYYYTVNVQSPGTLRININATFSGYDKDGKFYIDVNNMYEEATLITLQSGFKGYIDNYIDYDLLPGTYTFVFNARGTDCPINCTLTTSFSSKLQSFYADKNTTTNIMAYGNDISLDTMYYGFAPGYIDSDCYEYSNDTDEHSNEFCYKFNFTGGNLFILINSERTNDFASSNTIDLYDANGKKSDGSILYDNNIGKCFQFNNLSAGQYYMSINGRLGQFHFLVTNDLSQYQPKPPMPEPVLPQPTPQPTVPTQAVVQTKKKITKPKKAKIKKVKGYKKALEVRYAKVSGASGYQIQVATDKKFKKNKKTVTAKKSKTKVKISKLKKKKKYYVRIRAYKSVSGKKVYGAWSKVKTVKTK